MSITLVKIGGDGYVTDEKGFHHEYLADGDTDVTNLPNGSDGKHSRLMPRPGSRCLVAENGDKYVLNSARSWVKFFPPASPTEGGE